MTTDERQQLHEQAAQLSKCGNCNAEFQPPRKGQILCSRKCRNEQNGKRHAPANVAFWSYVQKSDGCWLWVHSKTKAGYGKFIRANEHIYAHRLSWEIHYGPVPDGLFVCHRCDNPSCVRPDHLFVGTHQDNVDDCVAKGRHLAFRPRVHGSRAGSAKLTEAQVVTIRQSYGTNGLTRRQLGQRYGVDKTTIDRILAKKIWRYV